MRPPGQKMTKLGAVFFKISFDPMFRVTEKNFTKNFHTNFHRNGSFLGGMVTLRELGLNAEIGVVPRNEQINRGVGKFYNETPLIDDQRLIIYIAAVCIVTSHRYCSPPRLKCWEHGFRQLLICFGIGILKIYVLSM